MAYVAVLDANVLHPHICVDLLLRLADKGLFRPVWSKAIIDELLTSLLERRLPRAAIERRIDKMLSSFEEAMVEGAERFDCVVPAEVDVGDAHVVAAAVAARADGIVTQNVRDFAPEVLATLGLELQSLDEFLVNQWTLGPEIVLAALSEMEADRDRPPKTIDELLDALVVHAPRFVAEVRSRAR